MNVIFKDFFWQNSINKRKVVLFLFVVFWVSIGYSLVKYGWMTTWEAFNLPALSPVFADMRTVQGSVISIEQGVNPQIENPGDPWNRVMNYPYVWVYIATFFHMGNEIFFLVFMTICVLTFLASCFFLLRDFPNFYILTTMLSGASLLAIERGNNDLIIFILLFISIYSSQGLLQISAFTLSTVLKVYPVFALLRYTKKPKMLLLVASMISLYFLFEFNELNIIKGGNTASGVLSYGLPNMINGITGITTSHGGKNILIVLSILVSILILVFVIKKVQLNESGQQSKIKELFITGGTIFTCTYLLSPNWDYRLIFLIFCLPYILSINNRSIKYPTMVCLFISHNIVTGEKVFPNHIENISFVCKHFIFIIILACLIKESYVELFPLFSGLSRKLGASI